MFGVIFDQLIYILFSLSVYVYTHKCIFYICVNEGVSLSHRVFKDSSKMAMEIILGEDYEVKVFIVLMSARGKQRS